MVWVPLEFSCWKKTVPGPGSLFTLPKPLLLSKMCTLDDRREGYIPDTGHLQLGALDLAQHTIHIRVVQNVGEPPSVGASEVSRTSSCAIEVKQASINGGKGGLALANGISCFRRVAGRSARMS